MHSPHTLSLVAVQAETRYEFEGQVEQSEDGGGGGGDGTPARGCLFRDLSHAQRCASSREAKACEMLLHRSEQQQREKERDAGALASVT